MCFRLSARLYGWIGFMAVLSVGASAQEARLLQARPKEDSAVRAMLTVTAAGGQNVPPLKEADVSAQMDGARANIRSFRTNAEGPAAVSIVIAIDVSQNMQDPLFHNAKIAAQNFIQNAPEHSQYAIVRFGTKAEVLQTFTADKQEAEGVLDSLQAKDGQTALYDGTILSVVTAAAAPTDHSLVVVLTNGKDTNSVHSLTEACTEGTAKNIPIFTIGITAKADEPALRQIASATGGEFLSAATADEIELRFTSIEQILKNTYDVVVEKPTSYAASGNSEHTLLLTVQINNKPVNVKRGFTDTSIPALKPEQTPKQPVPTPGPAPKQEVKKQLNNYWVVGMIVGAFLVMIILIKFLNRPWDKPQGSVAPPEQKERERERETARPEPSPSSLGSGQIFEEMGKLPVPPSGHYSLLVFRSGPQKGERVCLDNNWPGNICVIGRSAVPENQVVLQHDDRVGRVRHAEILRDSQGFYSIENRHANGVWVNGQKIDRKTTLQAGDLVRIGGTEFEYVNITP